MNTASGDPAWAEINGFSFYVPHHNLHIGIYLLLRPALGVASASVFMNSRDAMLPWRADYSDMRSHLPLPEAADLDDLELANGLHVRSTSAGATRHFSYDDGCGTGFDVEFQSLMAPFDAFDPTHNPLAPILDSTYPINPTLHYEQTGRFVGTLRLHGEPMSVDCVSTLNRGSGLRHERGQQPPATPNMSWLHAHFGEDLAIHATMSFDQRRGGTDLGLLRLRAERRSGAWVAGRQRHSRSRRRSVRPAHQPGIDRHNRRHPPARRAGADTGSVADLAQHDGLHGDDRLATR